MPRPSKTTPIPNITQAGGSLGTLVNDKIGTKQRTKPSDRPILAPNSRPIFFRCLLLKTKIESTISRSVVTAIAAMSQGKVLPAALALRYRTKAMMDRKTPTATKIEKRTINTFFAVSLAGTLPSMGFLPTLILPPRVTKRKIPDESEIGDMVGPPVPTRTADPQLRRLLLYPAELRAEHTLVYTQRRGNDTLSYPFSCRRSYKAFAASMGTTWLSSSSEAA